MRFWCNFLVLNFKNYTWMSFRFCHFFKFCKACLNHSLFYYLYFLYNDMVIRYLYLLSAKYNKVGVINLEVVVKPITQQVHCWICKTCQISIRICNSSADSYLVEKYLEDHFSSWLVGSLFYAHSLQCSSLIYSPIYIPYIVVIYAFIPIGKGKHNDQSIDQSLKSGPVLNRLRLISAKYRVFFRKSLSTKHLHFCYDK